MNFLLLLLICSFVIYTKQQTSDPAFIKKHSDAETACMAENNVTQAEVNADQDWGPNTDEDMKCFVKCMFLKFGVLTTSGDMVDDQLVKYQANFFNSTTDAAIVKGCADAEGPDVSDLCQVAYLFIKCSTQYL